MGRRKQSDTSVRGREARQKNARLSEAAVIGWTDSMISSRLPHLDDGTLGTSDHEPLIAEALNLIDAQYSAMKDIVTARSHLEKRIIRYNTAHHRNLHVAIAPVRFPTERPRYSSNTIKSQRELNIFHEKLMEVLDSPRIGVMSTDDRLGVLLYFAATLGGLSNPKLISALHEALVPEPKLRGHFQTKLVWLVLRYDSTCPNHEINDATPNTSRLWFCPESCQLPLLGYLNACLNVGPTTGLDSYALIRDAMGNLCPPGLPTMGFRDFCRVAICVAERQPGIVLHEYLASFATQRLHSASLPPEHWEYQLQQSDWRHQK